MDKNVLRSLLLGVVAVVAVAVEACGRGGFDPKHTNRTEGESLRCNNAY